MLIQDFNNKYDKKDGRKTIGLAGFYGYGNFGDELFLDVYAQFLSDDYNLRIMHDSLEDPYFSKGKKEAVGLVDGIVIGGGDIVQPWGMDPRYFSFEFLEKPVFIAGVGVPIRAAKQKDSNPNHVEKAWIVEKYRKFMSHKAVKFIHARDDSSCQWIENKISPSVVLTKGPDIVCSLDLPEVNAQRGNGKKVVGIVTRSRPGKENSDNFSHIAEACEAFVKSGWEVRHIILGTGKVFEADIVSATRLKCAGKSLVYASSTMELCQEIGKCDLLMSMKFHGSVVASMYGIPSVVMVPTSKNRSYMQRIGREDLISSFDKPDLIKYASLVPQPISDKAVSDLKAAASSVMRDLKAVISYTL